MQKPTMKDAFKTEELLEFFGVSLVLSYVFTHVLSLVGDIPLFGINVRGYSEDTKVTVSLFTSISILVLATASQLSFLVAPRRKSMFALLLFSVATLLLGCEAVKISVGLISSKAILSVYSLGVAVFFVLNRSTFDPLSSMYGFSIFASIATYATSSLVINLLGLPSGESFLMCITSCACMIALDRMKEEYSAFKALSVVSAISTLGVDDSNNGVLLMKVIALVLIFVLSRKFKEISAIGVSGLIISLGTILTAIRLLELPTSLVLGLSLIAASALFAAHKKSKAS